MKQARLIMDKAGFTEYTVVPNTGNRLHIRIWDGSTVNMWTVEHILAAFAIVGITLDRLNGQTPKHPYFASRWITFKVCS
jgi:hypothetical protein